MYWVGRRAIVLFEVGEAFVAFDASIFWRLCKAVAAGATREGVVSSIGLRTGCSTSWAFFCGSRSLSFRFWLGVGVRSASSLPAAAASGVVWGVCVILDSNRDSRDEDSESSYEWLLVLPLSESES